MSIRDHCDDIHRIYGQKMDIKIQYKLKKIKNNNNIYSNK